MPPIRLPDESTVRCTPIKCACTLVRLFSGLAISSNTDVGLPQPELPSLQRQLIATSCVIFDVEFQSRPVEAHRLSDRSDVCLFETEQNTKTSQDYFLPQIWANEGAFHGRQLNMQ